MSAEDLIREKHRVENEGAALRKSLQEWRKSFALLSNQEIELATAKVLDRTLQNPADRSMKLKLLVISATMKRRAIDHEVSAFKRFWLLADPQLLIEGFIADGLHVPIALDDEALRLLAQLE